MGTTYANSKSLFPANKSLNLFGFIPASARERPNAIIAGRDGYVWYTGNVNLPHNDFAPAVLSCCDPGKSSRTRYPWWCLHATTQAAWGDITNIVISPDYQLWVVVNDHPGVDIEKIALPS